MDLRDLTRETERARRVTPRDDYESTAHLLALEQEDLVFRTEDVIDAILELPDGESEFGRELRLLEDAAAAMVDAQEHLEEPTTGAVAVAAETEAIEHLLQARRSKGGGGGGGSNPGGGLKKGQTDASALALVGRSEDALGEVDDRDVVAASGRSGVEPPAELREALDRYFERLNVR